MHVEAAGEKLVPVVDGGLLRLVHQDELLPQAEPAGLGACLEGGAAVEDSPLDLRFEPLVLEGPDVAGQPGVHPLVGVLEQGFMVAIAHLPRGGGDPHVLLRGLPPGCHLGLVDHS